MEGSEQRHLVAVLLNPPATSTGVRSRNAVIRAARVLGYERTVVTNLCAVSTPSVVEVNALDREAWDLAQADLGAALKCAGTVLACWGIAGLSGEARRWMIGQVEWLTERAREVGIGNAWTVGGEPRHPSRWHQYVSDKYGRTTGGTFEERLAQVLVQVPFRAHRVASSRP